MKMKGKKYKVVWRFVTTKGWKSDAKYTMIDAKTDNTARKKALEILENMNSNIAKFLPRGGYRIEEIQGFELVDLHCIYTRKVPLN